MAVFNGDVAEEVASSDSDDGRYESYADLKNNGVLDSRQKATLPKRGYENVEVASEMLSIPQDDNRALQPPQPSPQLLARGAKPKFYVAAGNNDVTDDSSQNTDYSNSTGSLVTGCDAASNDVDIVAKLRVKLDELHRNGTPHSRRFSQADALDNNNASDVTTVDVSRPEKNGKKAKVKLRTKLKQKLARKSYSFEKTTADCFDDISVICDFEPLDQSDPHEQACDTGTTNERRASTATVGRSNGKSDLNLRKLRKQLKKPFATVLLPAIRKYNSLSGLFQRYIRSSFAFVK